MRLFNLHILLLCIALISCNENSTKNNVNKKEFLYLNHSDSAKYVGIHACKLCHQNIYNTFIETGMGQSLGVATKEKSAANFSHSIVKDDSSGYQYKMFWQNDSLYMKEFLLEKTDTIFKRVEHVNYIIGSGQHTNSHLQSINGYINQMPMTFYTQKKKWDLPPGFEGGYNTRFSRKIGLECMSCHNAYPNFILGSENKYQSILQGIDCERCHGPGSIHVAQRSRGSKIDTSKYIDYSIVNPAKLPIDLQFDICQRCHLQGNAILQEGKSFYDFKPGMPLSNFISVFLPKFTTSKTEFIMASHADRLKMSKCFIASFKEKQTELKPYKDALTCITCHNPHVTVSQTNANTFNNTCINCHYSLKKSTLQCTLNETKINFTHNRLEKSNCVSCHMPLSGSSDIPHVSIHDHFIRKPINKSELTKVKQFLGLFSINDKSPSAYTRARAYLNQYEKFEAKSYYLDSAEILLHYNTKQEAINKIHALVQLYFLRQKPNDVIKLITNYNEDTLIKLKFNFKSFDNINAWTCYRVAESYTNLEKSKNALPWLEQSCKLAPYNLEFRNKLAICYISIGNLPAAENELNFVLKEYPKNISAYTNLGYLNLLKQNPEKAIMLYNKALAIDPKYEPLLLNIAGYYAFMRDFKTAKLYLQKIISLNPNNNKAKQALAQLNSII
ncbi:MAG: tetratricopeptide repeat protein [Bacteroidetes bacterium]|nr:tetratricopeptide repeat protein [Bacteroidota bacterium]